MRAKPIKILYFAIAATTLPFVWLLTQMDYLGGVQYAWPNIAGLIGAALMLWQFLLGVRYISRYFTTDYVGVMKLHKNLGIYGMIFVLIHPLGEAFATTVGLPFLYAFDLSTEFNEHVTYGRIAFALFLIIWISSALLRKRITYRPWLYIHYLTYPMLAATFIHALEIGSFIQAFPFVRTYWMMMAFTFFIVLTIRGLKFLNFWKPRFELVEKRTHKDGITVYSFKPKRRRIVPKVGQFTYIKKHFIGEEHPFTVQRYDKENGVLEFGIKAVGRFTDQLEHLEIGDIVYMDGPYGVFTKEAQNDRPKVIFAGGIGVTPFVELIDRFGNKDTYMFYSNKVLENALERDHFKKELKENYMDVVSRERVKAPSIISGRVDAEVIKKNVPAKILEEAKFFICGSPGFMAGVTGSLAQLGIPKSRIFMEEFEL